MKKALITGISGQDGYFLSQFLLDKNYEVYGLVRRNSQASLGSLELLDEEIRNKIKICWGDITDYYYIEKLIKEIKPDELYHLAAQSFVGLSFENPKLTYDTNINGTLNIVNAVKEFSPKTKVYFAGTSELYGKAKECPQNEDTPFYPRSPYGISKLAGYWTIKNYRESYGLFMSNGILFNHESEVRGKEFITRKITIGLANIIKGKQKFIEIGNIDAKRDWGYTKDYVKGMWMILQYNKPDDFVLATGENHSIKEFVEESFKCVGISDWEKYIKINKEFIRPAEVNVLKGDYSKAKKELGWEPKTNFKELIKIMINNDLKK